MPEQQQYMPHCHEVYFKIVPSCQNNANNISFSLTSLWYAKLIFLKAYLCQFQSSKAHLKYLADIEIELSKIELLK